MNLKNSQNKYHLKRFRSLEKKRNIISEAIPASISKVEEESAHKWWTTHECYQNRKNGSFDLFPELWTPYPNIRLCPTSISTTIIIQCPFCGKEKNVSDFDRW